MAVEESTASATMSSRSNSSVWSAPLWLVNTDSTPVDQLVAAIFKSFGDARTLAGSIAEPMRRVAGSLVMNALMSKNSMKRLPSDSLLDMSCMPRLSKFRVMNVASPKNSSNGVSDARNNNSVRKKLPGIGAETVNMIVLGSSVSRDDIEPQMLEVFRCDRLIGLRVRNQDRRVEGADRGAAEDIGR